MSHEITITNGRAEAMYALRPAWHGLGTVLQECPTSAAALKAAGMDWEIVQRPVLFQPDLHMGEDVIECPPYVVNVRTDTWAPLGVVTSRYKPVQNTEAFEFLDGLTSESDLRYESCGSLNGGRTVWILARYPDADFTLPSTDDRQQQYILFTNTHDGTRAIRVAPTSVRVVCQNTLNLALGQLDRCLRIPHVGDIAHRLVAARDVLGIVQERVRGYAATAELLAAVRPTNDDVLAYFAELFPPPAANTKMAVTLHKNLDRKLRDLYFDDPCQQDGISRTAWAAVNAVTQYVDHGRSTWGANDRVRSENRMAGVLMGSGAGLKELAYSKAADRWIAPTDRERIAAETGFSLS